MAINYSYPKDLVLENSDLFSGIRASDNRTVNFTAKAVSNFLNTNGEISISSQLSFRFTIVENQPKTISFPGGGGNNTLFSNITELVVSIIDVSSSNVTVFLDYLVDSDILLSQQNEPNLFGHYKITGYTQNGISPFYTLSLEFIGGSGNIADDTYYDVAPLNLSQGGGGVTPTLQEVLDNNHDLVDGNFFAGTDAGDGNTGVSVIAVGESAGNGNSGDSGIFLGNIAGLINTGISVNALGSSAGVSNTFNYVNLLGENAQADEDGQTVLSKDGAIMARFSTTNLTDTRKYNLPDADGTIALTSDITIPTLQQVADESNILQTTPIFSYDNSSFPTALTRIEWDNILIHDFVEGNFNEGLGITKNYLQFLKFVDGSGFRGITLSYEELTDNDFKAINFPNASGTLALTSDIPDVTGYVPYTGATQDVNLGNNDIYVNEVFLYDAVNDNYGSTHYTDGNYHIEDADGHKLLVIEDGFVQIHKTDTIQSNLYTSALTAIRDHYLPNQSGTIALITDIPTVDTTPTDGSSNAVSSNGVFDALALKQDKSRYLYQGYTTVTGVVLPTIAISLLIPANTYGAPDGFEIIVNINKSPTATAVNYNLYHDTTINGTTNAIATGVSLTSTNRGSAIQRILNLSGGSAYNNLISSSTSLTTFLTASATPTTTTFNPAVNQYITLQISGLTVVSESSNVTMSIRPLKG